MTGPLKQALKDARFSFTELRIKILKGRQDDLTTYSRACPKKKLPKLREEYVAISGKIKALEGRR